MGLIRKSLSVTTAGVVKGSSKKQRVAKSIEANTKATAAASATAQRQAEALAEHEHRFRYDTDPTYRSWCDKQASDKLRARGALRLPGNRVVLEGRPFRGLQGDVLSQDLQTGLCRVRLETGQEVSYLKPKQLKVASTPDLQAKVAQGRAHSGLNVSEIDSSRAHPTRQPPAARRPPTQPPPTPAPAAPARRPVRTQRPAEPRHVDPTVAVAQPLPGGRATAASPLTTPSAEAEHAAENKIATNDQPVWHAGDRVILDIFGFRGQHATVVSRKAPGSYRIRLDSGKPYVGIVPANKMHALPPEVVNGTP